MVLINGDKLIRCSYNPHNSLIGNHFDALNKHLDLHSSTFENIITLVDFNTDIVEKHMKCFCDNYHLKSMIKQPTCSKNPDTVTCIDLLFTNAFGSFKNKCALKARLSDVHLMTLTVMRKSFKKLHSRIIKF